MASNSVRTRFAPSPTGYLHVGGARTALFNYLYARANNGSFILRVEDTDQERSSSQSEKNILESLDWLNIRADESPQKKGPFEPYRQSERLQCYEKYTKQLLTKKLAYPCFCTNEELQMKQEHAKVLGKPYTYDGKCRNLSKEEIIQRQGATQNYVIRFQTNTEKEIIVEDLVQGKIKFNPSLIGDFIILKSNGFPSYNYAVVIDDYEMKISHVIRGVGHLSNTPRQILIHHALDLALPQYAHISEIVGNDHKKLSKRRGATSILLFRDMGYHPQAFVNYMSLLGWYPRDSVEFMPGKKLGEKFEIVHCSKSPAMFDFFLIDEKDSKEINSEILSMEELKNSINKKSKLNWLNNLYMRELPIEEIWKEEEKWLKRDPELNILLQNDEKKIQHGFDCVRKYLYTFAESIPYLKELFQEKIEIKDKKAQELLLEVLSEKVIHSFLLILQKEKPQKPEDFTQIIKKVGKESQAKGRLLFMPIRIATTGTMEGLELPILFSILGYERVIQRLQKTKHIWTHQKE